MYLWINLQYLWFNGRWKHIPKVTILVGAFPNDNIRRVTTRAFRFDKSNVPNYNVSTIYADLGPVLFGGMTPDFYFNYLKLQSLVSRVIISVRYYTSLRYFYSWRCHIRFRMSDNVLTFMYRMLNCGRKNLDPICID